MDKPDTATCVIEHSVTTARVPLNQPQIHVMDNLDEQIILIQETMEEISCPAQIQVSGEMSEKDIEAAGMLVFPFTGGGRGPVINYGETITIALLLSLLVDAISEEQLSEDLNARLDAIPSLRPNSKAQEGYASHNDLVILDHDWFGRPPKISLELSHGQLMKTTQTVVGIDPDCITYVEVPEQEIIYGHTGFMLGNQFTVKAAIVGKEGHVTIPIDWAPDSITGPPVTNLTTLSPVFMTSEACIGMRIQGSLTVANTAAYEVSGTMYAQMSVDGGPWVDIAGLSWTFGADEATPVTEKFDTLVAYDQVQHTYQFRGRLVTDSNEEINRDLTGSIQVDTLTESGSGPVLSNALQLKWSCKE